MVGVFVLQRQIYYVLACTNTGRDITELDGYGLCWMLWVVIRHSIRRHFCGYWAGAECAALWGYYLHVGGIGLC